jgi:3-mercaptopyruvate sulfurtransferase SseA
VALQLRKIGIRRVRPLLGGFHEWKSLGFPLVEIAEVASRSSVSSIQAEGRA